MAGTADEQLEKLAVIGAGKMGETLISALLVSQVIAPQAITASARSAMRLQRLSERFGVRTEHDNRTAAAGADVVLLCVKPQVAPQVLAELRDSLTPDQLLLSIVAGLTTEHMERMLAKDDGAEVHLPVARAMPNTPARIGHGMTAVCGGRACSAQQLEKARVIFSRVGRSIAVEEKYFDAVTGLSASGPAFLYIVIEALAEGGVKAGLPRQIATELAAQTCLGAGHMVIETGDHPAQLKDEVTTPAGCTMDGILELEEGGLRVTLIKAVIEARRRAAELVG